MFNEFLASGSILAVILMGYVNCVMIETVNSERAFHGMNTPPIIKHPATQFLRVICLPCIFWPAIYVGLYSGFWAGFVAWFGIQLVSAFLSFPLRIKALPGVHVIPAAVAMPIGYYLSLTNLPT